MGHVTLCFKQYREKLSALLSFHRMIIHSAVVSIEPRVDPVTLPSKLGATNQPAIGN